MASATDRRNTWRVVATTVTGWVWAGSGGDRSEPPVVRGLQQHLDRGARPRGEMSGVALRRDEDEVGLVELGSLDRLGVADDPQDVALPRGAPDRVLAAQDEVDVARAGGQRIGPVEGVQVDDDAERAQAAGQAVGEVPVAPLRRDAGGGRGDGDGDREGRRRGGAGAAAQRGTVGVDDVRPCRPAGVERLDERGGRGHRAVVEEQRGGHGGDRAARGPQTGAEVDDGGVEGFEPTEPAGSQVRLPVDDEAAGGRGGHVGGVGAGPDRGPGPEGDGARPANRIIDDVDAERSHQEVVGGRPRSLASGMDELGDRGDLRPADRGGEAGQPGGVEGLGAGGHEPDEVTRRRRGRAAGRGRARRDTGSLAGDRDLDREVGVGVEIGDGGRTGSADVVDDDQGQAAGAGRRGDRRERGQRPVERVGATADLGPGPAGADGEAEVAGALDRVVGGPTGDADGAGGRSVEPAADPDQGPTQHLGLPAVLRSQLVGLDQRGREQGVDVGPARLVGADGRSGVGHRCGRVLPGQGAAVVGDTLTRGVTPSAPLPFTITVLALSPDRTSRSIWM